MKEKIYLSVKPGPNGEMAIVDQYGREVYGVKRLNVTQCFDDVTTVDCTFVAINADGSFVTGRSKE